MEPSYHDLGKDIHYMISRLLHIKDLSNLSLTNKYHYKICNKIAKNRLACKKYNIPVSTTNYIQLLSVQIGYDWMIIYDTDDSVNMFEFCLLNIKYINSFSILQQMKNTKCIILVIKHHSKRSDLTDIYSSNQSCCSNKLITQYIVENYSDHINIDRMLHAVLVSYKVIDYDTVTYLISIGAKFDSIDKFKSAFIGKCELKLMMLLCDSYPHMLNDLIFIAATKSNRLDIIEYLMTMMAISSIVIFDECIKISLARGCSDTFIFWMRHSGYTSIDMSSSVFDERVSKAIDKPNLIGMLLKAITLKHIGIIEYLLIIIDSDTRNNLEILRHAYNNKNNDVAVFKYLIENGVTLNTDEYHRICGKSPIIYHPYEGDVIKYMISIGATDIKLREYGKNGCINSTVSMWTIIEERLRYNKLHKK